MKTKKRKTSDKRTKKQLLRENKELVDVNIMLSIKVSILKAQIKAISAQKRCICEKFKEGGVVVGLNENEGVKNEQNRI